MNQPLLRARAPGKLILLGEHAVLYGSPSIAIALKEYTRAYLTPTVDPFLSFCSDQAIESPMSSFDLSKSQDPSLRWIQEMIFSFEEKSFEQLQLRLESTLEPKSGMGSSAAAITASFAVLYSFLKQKISTQKELESHWSFLTKIESFCHGTSSGLDIAVALRGGCLAFEKGHFRSLQPPDLSSWYLFSTGAPAENTKESVFHSRKRFAEEPSLLEEMKQLAEHFVASFETSLFVETSLLIRQWHRLQKRLGLVTAYVSSLIEELECLGASAKVCGAGASRGKGSGIVLVLASADVFSKISQKKFFLKNLKIDLEGTCVLPLG